MSMHLSQEDFHCFVSVKQMIEQMKHDSITYRCRSVGVVVCEYGQFILHELDDENVRIRLSLAHSLRPQAFTGKPYAAQVFGTVQWKDGVGPVIQPYVLQSIPVSFAIRLQATLEWVDKTHTANRREPERKNI